MTERVPRRTRRQRVLRRVPLLIWLTLVWVMLWGTLDAGTVFFGLIVAGLVIVVFPMPAILTGINVRPVRVAQLAVFLAWDLVSSTLRVFWQSVRFGPNAKAGVVAVRLVTDSDHVTAMVCNAVSLAPGEFVLQLDRAQCTCYVYVLGMRAEEAESVRRGVLALERRIIHAVGSPEQVALVERVGGQA